MVRFMMILPETTRQVNQKIKRHGCSEKCHKQWCMKGNSHMRHMCLQEVQMAEIKARHVRLTRNGLNIGEMYMCQSSRVA